MCHVCDAFAVVLEILRVGQRVGSAAGRPERAGLAPHACRCAVAGAVLRHLDRINRVGIQIVQNAGGDRIDGDGA